MQDCMYVYNQLILQDCTWDRNFWIQSSTPSVYIQSCNKQAHMPYDLLYFHIQNHILSCKQDSIWYHNITHAILQYSML